MPIARGRLPTPCVSAHLLTLRKMKLPTAVDIAIERFETAKEGGSGLWRNASALCNLKALVVAHLDGRSVRLPVHRRARIDRLQKAEGVANALENLIRVRVGGDRTAISKAARCRASCSVGMASEPLTGRGWFAWRLVGEVWSNPTRRVTASPRRRKARATRVSGAAPGVVRLAGVNDPGATGPGLDPLDVGPVRGEPQLVRRGVDEAMKQRGRGLFDQRWASITRPTSVFARAFIEPMNIRRRSITATLACSRPIERPKRPSRPEGLANEAGLISWISTPARSMSRGGSASSWRARVARPGAASWRYDLLRRRLRRTGQRQSPTWRSHCSQGAHDCAGVHPRENAEGWLASQGRGDR